nr:CHAP domain-containing protein [Streptomyces olivoreticuli]
MSQADQVILVQKAEVGYKEGYSNGHYNNWQKFSPAVPGLEWSQNQAWCQTFQSWAFQQVGLKPLAPVTASCMTAVNWYKNKGRFSYYPAVGAMVFYGPNGGSHVGLVYKYDADYIYTVEGNTNTSGSAEGDGVYLKKRGRRDVYTYGYGYPEYADGLVSADPKFGGVAAAEGGKGDVPPPVTGKPWVWADAGSAPHKWPNDTRLIQSALKKEFPDIDLSSDKGEYREKSKEAYARWQESLGYSGADADGIPGRTSLTALGAKYGFEVRGEYPGTETDSEGKPTAPVSVERPWVLANVGSSPEKWPASTRLVREALIKEFGNIDFSDDGDAFGEKTKSAYSRWQKSLGYSGTAADGIPGQQSLRKLAEKYGFDIRSGSASASGSIGADQIDFSGKGSWDSGHAACTGYIKEALRIMGHPETHWLPGMLTIAQRETALNSPQWQINTTDSNARNTPELYGGGKAPDGYPGMCSRGMIQAIPQTFARYHQAGTSEKIYDPVASAAAGINYIITIYKVNSDGSNLTAKVQQADPNRPPKGY